MTGDVEMAEFRLEVLRKSTDVPPVRPWARGPLPPVLEVWSHGEGKGWVGLRGFLASVAWNGHKQ